MTTTTPSPARNRRTAQGPELAERGFTLVEVMISAAIGAGILAAVLSTFLFMGRSGANVQNYNDMETQARNALEFFAEDTRQARSLTWGATDANSVALVVDLNTITYTYSPTDRTFTRVVVVTSSSAEISRRTLVTGITSFAFSAYKINTDVAPLTTNADRTTANGTTKQIQISLEAARANRTVVAATNTVLSARFILRNKRVTA